MMNMEIRIYNDIICNYHEYLNSAMYACAKPVIMQIKWGVYSHYVIKITIQWKIMQVMLEG